MNSCFFFAFFFPFFPSLDLPGCLEGKNHDLFSIKSMLWLQIWDRCCHRRTVVFQIHKKCIHPHSYCYANPALIPDDPCSKLSLNLVLLQLAWHQFPLITPNFCSKYRGQLSAALFWLHQSFFLFRHKVSILSSITVPSWSPSATSEGEGWSLLAPAAGFLPQLGPAELHGKSSAHWHLQSLCTAFSETHFKGLKLS